MVNIKTSKYFFAYLLVFIWPFIYCYKFVISGESFSLTISNDFYYLYHCKVYLLDKLSNFEIPLWSPSEGCGYPFYSNPFTQVFYPFNVLLAAVYKIAGGYSYADHQKFAVLGISIFSTGLLLWLRSLRINILYAVIAVCLVSVSSKMTEILRFPNAVHTVAWIPFILYGCTLAMDNAKKFKAGLIIFASSVMMITAGYPYNVYHSIFLILPYILLIVFLSMKKICFREFVFSLPKYSALLFVSFTGALLLCYPYIKGIKELMNEIAFRKGDDFAFSTFFKFNFSDTVGSLIYPAASPIEGWYYFGIAALLMVSGMYIYIFINKNSYRQKFIILSLIALWFIIISYITYGENSYLFKLLWNYFPGFSRIRIWGRMNIIFLPAFTFLLAFSLSIFSKLFIDLKESKTDNKPGNKIFFITFIFVYLIILSVQIYFFANKTDSNYTISYSKSLYKELNESSFLVFSIATFILFISVFIASKYFKRKLIFTVFLIFIFLINTADLYNAGSMQWAFRKSPDNTRKIINVNELDILSLSVPRNDKNSLISLTSVFNVGSVDEWYFESYNTFLNNFKNSIVDDNMEKSLLSFNELLGIDNGKRFFCSQKINYELITDFTDDSRKFESSVLNNISIEKYTGDELLCTIDLKESGYFSFIDNYDKNWMASVNGKNVTIEKLFGTFKSLKLEKGRNKIIFKYSPDFF